MKKFVLISMVMVVNCACAWNSVSEMEEDFCVALTNSDYLLSAIFTNRLSSVTNFTSAELRCEVFMLSAIHAAQSFEVTADIGWIQEEMKQASNAVVVVGKQPDKWQYWMSRLVYAGACASLSNYEGSFCVMTNSLNEINSFGFTNDVSLVGQLLLKKYEMSGIGVREAMMVMAGMSAAVTGDGSVATNYANQVSVPYKSTILEFIK